ncbi:MAG: PAS domain-containing protein [Alphaproteobacteria bacterium]|nr:PAS domain-containing protein [Alphaproteobacteria bacterium]
MSPPIAFPACLNSLFALWNTKRGRRAMPSRHDFRTAELEPWLAELHLVAVRPEGLRFIVFAPGPATRYGAEMTGRYVADLEPRSMADEVEHAYLAAAETRTPVFGARVPQGLGSQRQSWSRLILPLSEDGLAVDRLFVAVWDGGIGVGARSPAAKSILTSKWILAEAFEFDLAQPVPTSPRVGKIAAQAK